MSLRPVGAQHSLTNCIVDKVRRCWTEIGTLTSVFLMHCSIVRLAQIFSRSNSKFTFSMHMVKPGISSSLRFSVSRTEMIFSWKKSWFNNTICRMQPTKQTIKQVDRTYWKLESCLILLIPLNIFNNKLHCCLHTGENKFRFLFLNRTFTLKFLMIFVRPLSRHSCLQNFFFGYKFDE